MECVAAIPVRISSARVPRKALIEVDGRPLFWHVWQNVVRSNQFASVIVCTDSSVVAGQVKSWGGDVIMTPVTCRCGSERIAAVLDQLPGDRIVNVQADMLHVSNQLLEDLVSQMKARNADVVTPVYQIREPSDLFNPGIVKVAIGAQGRALYFSRHPVPFVRDLPRRQWLSGHQFYAHIGLYGFRRTALAAYSSLPEHPLEESEQLEQLRLLASGCLIETFVTTSVPVAINSLRDVHRVRAAVGQVPASLDASGVL